MTSDTQRDETVQQPTGASEGAAFFKGSGVAGAAGGAPGQSSQASEGDTVPTGGEASAETPSQAGALSQRLLEMEGENAELRDRMMRLAADMENLRRRTEREIKDARQFAVANFARDMLAVSDNLARAIQALPEGARESGDAGFSALVEGVEMTGRAMLSTLERHGVRKLEPEGQRFDPNFHQAMFEVPNPDLPNNTVVQVVQDGYAIGERVLRPAMVGVAKGGPKAAPAGETPAKPGVPDESTKDA
ncbi:nucleotide exchange factor GrpE [Aureimonas jatrophae]|jgi:molecular chaperone GrpE|uniref:Protein GrpE n=1 Tax=Aureimonas jatrophae TaxID=1166073 RepID=A0A1H0D6F4_9HYPH|nr:nucleotide exchange factor GrpE [Aureimonas jatrophae]MBB3951730.1 molecular chaperone GrpE [Aureimonas jatrophae]SDN65754.1 molecular chaperone GrpE [Aureimonas jatrophae]